jgi:hypothetical protein
VVRATKKARTGRRVAVIEISDDEATATATVVKAERVVTRTTRFGVEILPNPYTDAWRAPPRVHGRAVKKEEVDDDF